MMTSTLLASIAGIVLSLLFSYVPGLSDWYGRQTDTAKRLVMLAILVLVAVGAYGLSCSSFGNQYVPGLTCDEAGASGLAASLVAALIANQATFLISPKVTP